jgi:hypothetical protein
MTVGDFMESGWLWLIAGVSAAGSLIACRKWVSRLFFFLLAPLAFFMVWIPVSVLVSLVLWDYAWAVLVSMMITSGAFFWVCMVLRNDGVGGVSLMEGPAIAGPRGREGGGVDVTIPPPPITHRRMRLR